MDPKKLEAMKCLRFIANIQKYLPNTILGHEIISRECKISHDKQPRASLHLRLPENMIRITIKRCDHDDLQSTRPNLPSWGQGIIMSFLEQIKTEIFPPPQGKKSQFTFVNEGVRYSFKISERNENGEEIVGVSKGQIARLRVFSE